jgi:hypothetical protein
MEIPQRLHDFVGSLLMGGLDPERPEWHCKLLCIEMADPGPALDTLFAKSIGGRFAMLRLVDPACLVAVLLADRPVPGDIANGGHVP